MHNQAIQNNASKKANEPKFYINYQTNIKNDGSVWGYRLYSTESYHFYSAHDYFFYNMHWAYKIYYLYFKSTPNLQGLLRPPKTCNSSDCLIAYNNQYA